MPGSAAGIVGVGFGRNRLPRVGGLRDGILGNLPQVAVADQRVERRGILPLVGVVLIDGVAHAEEIGLQHRLLRASDGVLVLDQPHRRQNRDQRDHDEQLDEREAAIADRCPWLVWFSTDARVRHSPSSMVYRRTSPCTSCRPGLAVRLRVDVVDVAAAPRRRVGPVAVGAHPPLGRMRHRIDRHAPQELQLASASGRCCMVTPSTSVSSFGG